MKIGELGGETGVNPKTIRYYEGIGLLPEPERRPSGYREYSESDVRRVRFIRVARRLGLHLSEISEILAFKDRAEPPCGYVLEVLDRQVGHLDRRIAEMEELRRELTILKKEAQRLPRDNSCYCSIIEHAGTGSGPPDAH